MTDSTNSPPQCPAADRLTLAIEMSGPAGSVALGVDGDLWGVLPLEHTGSVRDVLISTISQILERFSGKSDQISSILVNSGPGGFTSLRVCITTCKIMHLATGARITPVSAALLYAHVAEPTPPDERGVELLVCLSPKRGQWWVQRCVSGGKNWETACESCLLTPEAIKTADFASRVRFAVTDRASADHSALASALETMGVRLAQVVINAGDLFRFAHRPGVNLPAVDAQDLAPIYARRPEAVRLWEQRGGRT